MKYFGTDLGFLATSTAELGDSFNICEAFGAFHFPVLTATTSRITRSHMRKKSPTWRSMSATQTVCRNAHGEKVRVREVKARILHQSPMGHRVVCVRRQEADLGGNKGGPAHMICLRRPTNLLDVIVENLRMNERMGYDAS